MFYLVIFTTDSKSVHSDEVEWVLTCIKSAKEVRFFFLIMLEISKKVLASQQNWTSVCHIKNTQPALQTDVGFSLLSGRRQTSVFSFHPFLWGFITFSITASLSPNCTHLVELKKSHLHGTSLGAEFRTAISHCRTKWISKCFHSHYPIFMCFIQTAVLLLWGGLRNFELSIGISISLLVMKSPVVE